MKREIIVGICIMCFVFMLSSCASHTDRIAQKLDPSALYPMYKTKPINLESQSKCPYPPSVKLVNNETRSADFSVADMPGYTNYAKIEIIPKDLTNHVVNYMSDAFGKCKVNVGGSSTKVIEVSIDNVAIRINSIPFTPMGAGIWLKINIPETKYTQIYTAEEWSGVAPFGTIMAWAIHLATWKIINDPVIQNYVLCR